MSHAREEVIETVRDYKTSKHWGECRPLRVTGLAGIVWEPSCEDVNSHLYSLTPPELFSCLPCLKTSNI